MHRLDLHHSLRTCRRPVGSRSALDQDMYAIDHAGTALDQDQFPSRPDTCHRSRTLATLSVPHTVREMPKE